MFHVPAEARRIDVGPLASRERDGNNGAFLLRKPGLFVWVIASDGLGWEHVNVHGSYDPRGKRMFTPSWELMCWVKRLWWDPEDVVMQLHPRESEYVNHHEHTLHLWRPIGREIPTPAAVLVGLRPGGISRRSPVASSRGGQGDRGEGHRRDAGATGG